MRISLFLSFVLFTLSLHAQNETFEGTITYSVEFEMKGQLTNLKDQIIDQLKSEGGYYDTIKIHIKAGKYKKVDNSTNQKSIIYIPDENKIYSLEEGSEFVSIIDASKTTTFNLNLPEPEFSLVDSVKYIKGIPCEALKLSTPNIGEEWYFYNKETAVIAPKLYAKHNYEYLNRILSATGAYPLEILKSMNNMISIRMSFVSVEEVKLSDNIFSIPELKKANKKMSKLMNDLTGAQVMEIKN